MILKDKLLDKFREALAAVLPIVLLVMVLSLSVAPIPSGVMLSFLMGTVMLIFGMMFFSVGAEVAMQPMGELTGASIRYHGVNICGSSTINPDGIINFQITSSLHFPFCRLLVSITERMD